MNRPTQWKAELEAEISREKIIGYAEILPFLVAGSFLPAILILFLMWGGNSQSKILVWFLLFLFHALFRFYRHYAFRQHPNDINLRREKIEQVVSAAINGSFWGWLLFIPEGIPYEILLLVFCLIACFCGIGVMAVGFNPLAYGAYAFCALVPLEIFLITSGGAYNFVLAGMPALAGMVIYKVTRRSCLITNTLITLKIEKQMIAQELEEKNKLLTQANEAKSRLISAASHDLRQPVYGVTLMFNKMVERCRKHNKNLPKPCPVMRTEKEIWEIDSALHYLSQSLNNLLDFSRLEAGAVSVAMRPVSLSELFSRLALEFTPQAAVKNIGLRFRASQATVLADHTLLYSILSNLVINAITYSDSGNILIAARLRNGRFRIYVIDQGIGIPAEHLESREIFGEYSRISCERKGLSCAGLGLAIAERFAHSMESGIEVTSRVNKGSCFYLDLPACQQPSPPGTAILLPGGAAMQGFANLAAMVVTADSAQSGWIVDLLQENGANTSQCATVPDALLWENENPHGVMVVDLPESGASSIIAECAAIGKRHDSITIIVLSTLPVAKHLPRAQPDFDSYRLVDRTSLTPLKLRTILVREICRKMKVQQQ